jgi:hypothetical protein
VSFSSVGSSLADNEPEPATATTAATAIAKDSSEFFIVDSSFQAAGAPAAHP